MQRNFSLQNYYWWKYYIAEFISAIYSCKNSTKVCKKFYSTHLIFHFAFEELEITLFDSLRNIMLLKNRREFIETLWLMCQYWIILLRIWKIPQDFKVLKEFAEIIEQLSITFVLLHSKKMYVKIYSKIISIVLNATLVSVFNTKICIKAEK